MMSGRYYSTDIDMVEHYGSPLIRKLKELSPTILMHPYADKQKSVNPNTSLSNMHYYDPFGKEVSL